MSMVRFSAANARVDGQFPSVVLDAYHSRVIGARQLGYPGIALFTVGYYVDSVFPPARRVCVFRQATALQNFQVPDFCLNDPTNVVAPISIDVVKR